MKKTQGFTLIELLVVIAIIGILSSIVIASLNQARTKGAVAAVKGGMAQVRAQAENYYDSNSQSYGAGAVSVTTAGVVTASASTVWSDTVVQNQLKQIASNANASVVGNSTANAWSISTTLKNGNQYCIANDGTNKEATTTASQAAGTCS